MFDFTDAKWVHEDELTMLDPEIERCWDERVLHHCINTPGGLRITAAEIRPKDFLGQLVIIPGRGETAHKYAELFYSLERMQIRAAVIFPRGQGLSDRLLPDRQKCHMACFDDTLSDIAALIAHLGFDDFGMLAFSLGGLEALSYVYECRQRPSALALIAPFLWPANQVSPMLLRGVVGLLGHLPLCKTSFTPYGNIYRRIPFEENHHSHSQIRYARYHDYYTAHPELTIGSPTWGFVAETTSRQVRLHHSRTPLPVPVFCMNCELDRVVSRKASESFFNAHMRDKLAPEVITIKHAFHDVLNERDEIRNPALTQALNFLKGKKND